MTTNTTAVDAMIDGRRADSTRRRQHVLTALDNAIKDGAELSVTSISRRAGVDRTFLYRHRDLLERIHTAETQPPDKPGIGPAVTRASLQADLLAAQQRCTRMTARTQQLETRLSELLGEQAWRATGLGAPTDIDQLQQRILTLEQQIVELRLQLEERDQDLAAARAANRELMAQLNVSPADRLKTSACTTPVAHHILQQPAARTAENAGHYRSSGRDPKRTGCTKPSAT
jgi:transposase-like protein